VPQRRGADSPGDADLPLSRPLHVRPGQVPLQGRSAEDACRAGPDRAGQEPAAGGRSGQRGRAEGNRQGGPGHRRRCGGVRPERSGAGRVRALHRYSDLRAHAMPTEILMPALSPTMEEGNLARWLKAEGDKVSAGDVIAEIETDKATMEVEAVDEGILARVRVPEGAQGSKVTTPIALLQRDGEDEAAATAPQADAGRKPAPAPAPAGEAAPAKVPAQPKHEAAADPDIPAGTEMVR